LDTVLVKKWIPWCESLPLVVDTCLSWDFESIEYQLLAGTGLQNAIQTKLLKLEREYEENVNLFKPIHESITLDHFAWADFIVWSRAMSLKSAGSNGKDDLHIIPVIGCSIRQGYL
jgi:hypothetical protein